MLYPNPASGILTIEFMNDETESEINIVDLEGRIIIHSNTDRLVSKLLLNISALKSGMYIVLIKTDENLIQKKLMVTEN